MAYNPCENTQIQYSGNGSQTDFTFQFTYIDETDVIVWLYEDLKNEWIEQTNKYVFAGPTVVRFLTAPPRPTNAEGYNIIIGRRTNVATMEATFYPGSSIRAQDLNNNFEQLRAGIEDGRCEISSTIEDLKYDYWGKKSISRRDSFLTEDPPNDTTYREDQEQGFWNTEGDSKSVPTTGAVSARLDPYVGDNLPDVPPENGTENPGKLWINTREYWDSYWEPAANAWIAYVNTGPRGQDGIPGTPGEKGDPGFAAVVGRIGPGAWNDIVPTDPIKYALYISVAPITGFPGGGTPRNQDALGWDGERWINYGLLGDLGPIGPQGEAATVTVGSTETLEPTEDADVENVGTVWDAILKFKIPRGEKGEKGDSGEVVGAIEEISGTLPVEVSPRENSTQVVSMQKASAEQDGYMSKEAMTKLDSISTGGEINVDPTGFLQKTTTTNTLILEPGQDETEWSGATTLLAGLMTATDKQNLEVLWDAYQNPDEGPDPELPDAFPSGTKMVFVQENPPEGWTLDTTFGDRVLKINGAQTFVDKGGTLDFMNVFKNETIQVAGSTDQASTSGSSGNTGSTSGNIGVNNSTLSGNQMPSHSHKYHGTNGNDKGSGGWNEGFWGKSHDYSDKSGGSSGHNHSGSFDNHSHSVSGSSSTHDHGVSLSTNLNLSVKYANTCIGIKN